MLNRGKISGFTLLEVVISLSVVAMVGIVLFSSFNYYINISSEEDFQFTADFLARQLLAEWKRGSLRRKQGNLKAYPFYKYHFQTETLAKGIKQIKVYIEKDGSIYSVSSYYR